LFPLHH